MTEAEQNQRITDALSALRPESDDDWTRDGRPSMEAVRERLDDDTVTRAMVDAAAPEFRRSSAVGETLTAEPSDAETIATDELDERTVAEMDRDRQVAAIEVEKDELTARARALTDQIRACDRRIDDVRAEFSTRFPPLTQHQEFQRVLARQHEVKIRRLEQERRAAAILGTSSRSPLDRSMQARRGFGISRPQYPNLGGRK
jgi:uncharacterized protein YuzE